MGIASHPRVTVVALLVAACRASPGLTGMPIEDATLDGTVDAIDGRDPWSDPDVGVEDPVEPPEGSHWILTVAAEDLVTARSVTVKRDGTIFVMGSQTLEGFHDNLWMMSVDGNAHVLDQRWVNLARGDPTCVTALDDGGIAFAALTPYADMDIWLVRLASDGEVAWQRRLGGPAGEHPIGILETRDGGILVAAVTESFSPFSDLWLVKLDADATILWQIALGGDHYEASVGNMGVVQDDGHLYYAVTSTLSFTAGGYDVWVVCFDEDGVVQRQRALGGESDEHVHGVHGDWGITMAGSTRSLSSEGMQSSWILRMTPRGEVEWQNVISAGFDDLASGIVALPGGYVMTGGAVTDPGLPRTSVAYLAPVAMDGSLGWPTTIGIDEWQMGHAVAAHGDAIVVAGGTGSLSPPPGDSRALVARLAMDGTFEGDCPFMDVLSFSTMGTGLVPRETDAEPYPTPGTIAEADLEIVEVDYAIEVLCVE